MRFVYFGDGLWARRCLQALLDNGHAALATILRREPSDDSLQQLSDRLGIPCRAPERVNAAEFVEWVRSLEADLNVSMSYDQILRGPILQSARLGFVNCHAGKLPYYRGRSVINWALINNEPEIGLTVHYVDEGTDTGDIILQRTLPISWEDTYGSVLDRVQDAFPPLLVEAFALIGRGEAPRIRQAHLDGTYFSGRSASDEWIDWSDTSLNIYNKIRAISPPGPGAKTSLAGTPLTVWQAEFDPAWPTYLAIPGQVVGVLPGRGVKVKTGDKTVVLTKTQLVGAPEETPTFRIGTRLGLSPVETLHRCLRHLEQHPDAASVPRVPCVILGGGGNASVVVDMMLQAGEFAPFGILDADPAKWGAMVQGVSVLGDDRKLAEVWQAGVRHFMIGLGSVGDNRPRRELFELACRTGFQPALAVHPRAVVAKSAMLGGGTAVMAGAVINPGARIGRNVLVNTSAIVEHDCIIEDHAFIAPGAQLASSVHIREAVYVGLGASVRQGINIGTRSLVGAGAVVVADIPDGVVVVGVPARVLRLVGS